MAKIITTTRIVAATRGISQTGQVLVSVVDRAIDVTAGIAALVGVGTEVTEGIGVNSGTAVLTAALSPARVSLRVSRL